MEDAVVKFIKKHAKTQWMLRWLADQCAELEEEVCWEGGGEPRSKDWWLQQAEMAFEDWRNNTQGGRG